MTGEIENTTMRRVYWRLIPFLFVALFFNYLDRINIGFASLHMNQDIGLSPSVFGFGASVFFVGYMLLEVPSNMMLHKFGARRWIARILVSWGMVSAATAFVVGPNSFYAMRLLLGCAEAGFLPGLALYLTSWFPTAYRARAVAGYIIAGQVAAVIGAPISTALMTYGNDWFSLHGWQWMFILEGVPTMLLGVICLFVLTERPADATWLEPAQRDWLEARLASERAALEGGQTFKIFDAVTDGRVWALAILFGCALVGIYGMLIWLPQIVKSMGHFSDMEIGLLSAVPPLVGVVGSVLVGRHSDLSGDRKKHLSIVYLVSGVALGLSAFMPNPTLAYLLLCVAGVIASGNALFWSLNSSMMTGAASAVCIALVNTIAQFGGLVGPWMIGLVKDSTGSFAMALLTLAAFLFVSAAIAWNLRTAPRTRS
jgi:ACS family tartrate transporter-like MFS transporter